MIPAIHGMLKQAAEYHDSPKVHANENACSGTSMSAEAIEQAKALPQQ